MDTVRQLYLGTSKQPACNTRQAVISTHRNYFVRLTTQLYLFLCQCLQRLQLCLLLRQLALNRSQLSLRSMTHSKR